MSRVDVISTNRILDEKLCAVCKKECIFAEARMAELPAVEQEEDVENHKIWCRTYQAIGIRYTHFDKSVCDKALYELVEI